MTARRSAELDTYQRKRDFSRTSEPEGEISKSPSGRLYLIQKHAASRLHYDLRLELGGVLKSWALPKGPSLDPEEKRLAVQVEDHPVEYGSFEGIIPDGEYGGGTVMLWDQGKWEVIGDPEEGLRKGHLSFRLQGKRLRGSWTLARMGGKSDPEEKNWLLIKKRDEVARPEAEYSVTREELTSVVSGRGMEEIAGAADSVWKEGRAVTGDGDKQRNETASVTGVDPSGLTGARKASMPKALKPQLAVAMQEAPAGEEWLHEIKYDGYRLLCFIDRGKVRLLSRRGQDWTAKFRAAATAAVSLPLTQAILDGEMVVLDEKGLSDFQALQNFLRKREEGNLVYYLFDLIYCEGYDLMGVPLLQRKELLHRLLPPLEEGGILRYSDHFTGRGDEVFRHACRFALEGIISKRAQSTYLQKRSSQWRKIKCLNRQEFVIGGFSEPGGGRSGLGALLLGYYEASRKLVFCGKVGTGFSEEVLQDLRRRLEPLGRKSPPFVNPPVGGEARGVHWVRPELVAEVEFTSWTHDGRLRHPSYKGLREDKDAAEVRREESAGDSEEWTGHAENVLPSTPNLKRSESEKPVPIVAGVRLSNPERILYPEQGVTKRALAEFYERIGDFVVPHLIGRPLSLFRCPQGRHKECFFQKHFADDVPEYTRSIPIREKEEERDYLVVDDLPGVISLVQLGVLEFHPWPSREDRLENPDRMVFDLDPDPGIGWEAVIEGAFAVRDLLGELGLQSFLKTTGGKGVHVVVPLVRRSSWEEVKAFSRAVAERLVEQAPRKYVATMSKSKRRGRTFIDHFRNSRGATSVAAYSTRARPGASVSTPLRWDELTPAIRPDHFTIDNLPRRLAQIGADPWEGFFKIRQSLTKAMKEELKISGA